MNVEQFGSRTGRTSTLCSNKGTSRPFVAKPHVVLSRFYNVLTKYMLRAQDFIISKQTYVVGTPLKYNFSWRDQKNKNY